MIKNISRVLAARITFYYFFIGTHIYICNVSIV